MKIADLRSAMKTAAKADLEKALIHVYKQLKKPQKEACDEDLLALLSGGTPASASAKSKITKPDIRLLQDEVGYFLDNAEDRLYYIPNRTVPKAKRSNWRNEVHKYYKDLLLFTPEDGEACNIATDLLTDLYAILCRGNVEYTFTSTDPFSTSRISQIELITLLAERLLQPAASDENLHTLLDLAIAPGTDSKVRTAEILQAIASQIPDADMNQRFLQIIDAELSGLPAVPPFTLFTDYNVIALREEIARLPQLKLLVLLQNDIHSDQEVYDFIISTLQNVKTKVEVAEKKDNSTEEQIHNAIEWRCLNVLRALLDQLEWAGAWEIWKKAYTQIVDEFSLDPGSYLKEKYEAITQESTNAS